jgi:tyrosine-protein kinase Etk/Wzc
MNTNSTPTSKDNSNYPSEGTPSVVTPEEDEISLLELATALGEEKKLILGLTATVTALAVMVSLLMTPIFTAKTVIMPPQQQQSSAASALASLGALAGIAGGAAGIKSPDEMYIAFTQSVGFQNEIIKRFDLLTRFETKTLTDTRLHLLSVVKVSSDKKSGLITIEVDDKDPEFAANLANAYVEELGHLLDRLAVTDAQQRRLFFQGQIEKVKVSLAKAEASFLEAKERSGMKVTAVIAESGVRATAELRGQIAAREVQLRALSQFATPMNPDVQKISSELSALRAQLDGLEKGSGKSAPTGVQEQAISAYRDIKVQEAVLEVLIKQFELARVDESKEGPLIQVVDKATAPEKKTKPKRAVIVLVSASLALLLSVLVAMLRRSLLKMQGDLDSAGKLLEFKRAWRWSN